MTPHPMTGTSLGPEARLLVYFHWAFPEAATAGWELVHKQKGSGWLSHVVTDNIYIYQTNFVSLNQIASWKDVQHGSAYWIWTCEMNEISLTICSWKNHDYVCWKLKACVHKHFRELLRLKKAKEVEKGDEWSCYGYNCSSSSIHIMKTRIG